MSTPVSAPARVAGAGHAGAASSHAAKGASSAANDKADAADAFSALLDGLTAAVSDPGTDGGGAATTAGTDAQAGDAKGKAKASVLLPDGTAAATALPGLPQPADPLPQLLGNAAAGAQTGQAGAAADRAGAQGTQALAGTGRGKPDAGLLPGPATPAPATPSTAATNAAFSDIAGMLRAEAARSDSKDGAAIRLPEALPLTQAAAPSPITTSAPAQSADAVYQASLASQPQDPAFAGDLAAEVRVMMDSGLQKAELRLNPADLGPIQIQLSVTAQTADISFSAAHSATRDGITEALPALREMLASQGMSLGHAGVSQGQQGQQQQQQADAGQQTRRRGEHTADGLAGIGAAAASRTVTVRAGRGMLDIYA